MNTKLSVNINKIASLRNARGGKIPDVVEAAIRCEQYGADGITVHPRPDERHITRQDVIDLKKVVTTEFNIEGFPDERFMKLIREVQPQQATLVPDSPEAITSNAGWDTETHESFLKDVISEIRELGIRTSIFVSTDLRLIEHAKTCGTDRIELYTEPFAELFPSDPVGAVKDFTIAAELAHHLGLGVNAGHDLSLINLAFFKKHVPYLAEVSIGHALISDALYFGMENTIQLYKRQLI